MINFIKGTVTYLNSQSVSISLNNIALGFEIFIPQKNSLTIGQEISFYVYMHWNQENGPTLFGFSKIEEKNIFQMIISCSGIGPKIGLAVLSQMEASEFIRAINEQDIKALSSINGIGAKKAEQIILQLKHKVVGLMEAGIIENNENFKHIKSVNEVLSSLNYSRQEISGAMDYLRNNYLSQSYTFDQMLKHALSYLSKKI